jgi:hypothetical protein
LGVWEGCGEGSRLGDKDNRYADGEKTRWKRKTPETTRWKLFVDIAAKVKGKRELGRTLALRLPSAWWDVMRDCLNSRQERK